MDEQARDVVITIRAKNLTDTEAKGASQAILGLSTQIDAASAAAQRATPAFKTFVTDGMTKAGLAATESSQMIAGMSASALTAATSGGTLHTAFKQVDGMLASLGVHIAPEIKAMGELGEVSGKTASQVGKLGTAGLVLGAGVAGWKVGRLISDFFDLDVKIGNATAKLMGWGDVAGEVAGAKQDVITRAIERGAAATISYSDALRFNTDWANRHNAAADKGAKASADWAEAMVEVNSAGVGWKGTLATISGETAAAVRFYLEAGVSQNALAKAYGLTDTQVKAVASSIVAEKTATEKATAATLKAAQAQRDFEKATTISLKVFAPAAQDFNVWQGRMTTGLIGQKLAVLATADAYNLHLTPALDNSGGTMKRLRTEASSLELAMKDFPQIMQDAFTGGGGVGGAVDALGTKIGTNLFGEGGGLHNAAIASTDSLKKMFGDTIGGALGAAIPGIGALIGPGLKLLWDGIKRLFGGPSQAELEGRSLSAAFQAQIASMLTSQQRLEAGGQQWKMTSIGIRDLYLSMGKTAADADRVTRMLFDTKRPGSYKQAIQEVQDQLDRQKATLDGQAQAHQALDDAVAKYGFTVEELGPKFRAQKLHEMAEELFGDYGLLTGSGIAVGDVTKRMADKVNDYVQSVRAAGAEVPAEMRPMLEAMAKQGLLTDANGNKVTDLKDAGITFADTMTVGFQHVVDKLDDLLVGLGIKLPAALDKIPKNTDVNVTAHLRSLPEGATPEEMAAYRNYVDAGVPGHARGGVFSRPHLARIAEGGEPEIIGSQAFMAAALHEAMGGGRESVGNIVVNVNTPHAFFDSPASRTRLGDYLAGVLADNLMLQKRVAR